MDPEVTATSTTDAPADTQATTPAKRGGLWARLRSIKKGQLIMGAIALGTLIIGFLAYRAMKTGTPSTTTPGAPDTGNLPTAGSGAVGSGIQGLIDAITKSGASTPTDAPPGNTPPPNLVGVSSAPQASYTAAPASGPVPPTPPKPKAKATPTPYTDTYGVTYLSGRRGGNVAPHDVLPSPPSPAQVTVHDSHRAGGNIHSE